jgi:hypothetical protein
MFRSAPPKPHPNRRPMARIDPSRSTSSSYLRAISLRFYEAVRYPEAS